MMKRVINVTRTIHHEPLNKERPSYSTPPPITIWVHGTQSKPRMFPKFFHCEYGLNPATALHEKYHLRTIANLLDAADRQRFPLETFYFYGWSGSLSYIEREKAAQHLGLLLERLAQTYREKYQQAPLIRIITHSHGGNVALNLAKVSKDSISFKINELILLACPVQDATAYLVHDDIFEKIYSFYSTMDFVQIADPQLLYYYFYCSRNLPQSREKSIFSRRKFPPHEKVVQAQLKINGWGVPHLRFLFNTFSSLLPILLDEAQAAHQEFQNTPHLLVVKTKKSLR